MPQYEERQRVVEENGPNVRPPMRPVVESRRATVIHDRAGFSAAAVAAMIIAVIAAAVLISALIISSNSSKDTELAQAREDAASAERAAAQPAQQQPQQQPAQPQQPPIVVTPPAAPAAPSESSEASNAGASLEVDVTSTLLEDAQMRSCPIDAKATGHVVTLNGTVPNANLKRRAETLARSVKGVHSVINNIEVKE